VCILVVKHRQTGDSSDGFRMLKGILSLGFVWALSNCPSVAGDVVEGASIEDVETNCTVSIEDKWKERIQDLEEKMKTLEHENKYLKTKSYKTCHELQSSPYKESGFYWLDPDGSGTPIELFCDMEKGVTEVGHNHETTQNVTWCKGEGCYTLQLEYTVPDTKIEALITMSEHCEQEILFECKMAPLKNTAFGQFYYGWWVDRHGERQFYFDGDNEDDHVCGCAKDKSCALSSFNSTCHCDSSLMPLWNSDSGQITNKASLPVRQFQYGAFFSEHQAAKVTIGKLKCSGKTKEKSDQTSTCSSLKKGGLSVDGFYLLKGEPKDMLEPGFCALSKSGYSEADLRIKSEDMFLSKRITFNITSMSCSNCKSCGSSSGGYIRSYCTSFYWISDIEVDMNYPTPYISIDKAEGSITFTTEGFYVLFPEATSNHMYLGNNRISETSSQWIEKNEKLKFQTSYNQLQSSFGTFAIIKLRG